MSKYMYTLLIIITILTIYSAPLNVYIAAPTPSIPPIISFNHLLNHPKKLSLSPSLTCEKSKKMMGEKEQRAAYPLAPANGYSRSDEEAVTVESEELRRQKRKKLIIYIVAFVIFQIGVITLFSLTVMKVKTPKFRVRSATFDSFDVQTSTNNPSFNLKMNAQLGVKNTNFGRYKYDDSTINFYYRDTQVGSAVVTKSKAKMLSTKKFNIVVDLIGANNSNLASDLSSGILPLTSQSKLRGKVTLMLIMKKKKSTDMNCTMEINTNTQQLQKIKCK